LLEELRYSANVIAPQRRNVIAPQRRIDHAYAFMGCFLVIDDGVCRMFWRIASDSD
jgi:hypothetical protein